MRVYETDINSCVTIIPEVFRDHRGEFVMTYFKPYVSSVSKWVEDDISVSDQFVFRGMHGDWKTWKLVQCVYGQVQLVVLDCRKGSNTCGNLNNVVLSDKVRNQILIPPGCANGHLVLSDKAVFTYKQSEFYDRESQFTFNHDKLDIKWRLDKDKFILSDRDKNGPFDELDWVPKVYLNG